MVRVEVARQKLFALLLGGSDKAELEATPACHTIVVPALLKRAGKEMRLVIEGDSPATKPDPVLAKLVGQGVAFREQLLTSNGVGIAELAAKAGVSGSYYTRVLRLGFLAPEILTAIAHGRQPVGLNRRQAAERHAATPALVRAGTGAGLLIKASITAPFASSRPRYQASCASDQHTASNPHHGVPKGPKETMGGCSRTLPAEERLLHAMPTHAPAKPLTLRRKLPQLR